MKYFHYINSGQTRTIKIKKNIFYSFIIKGLNIIIGLILVPLTINYLNPTQYGIWITLSSVIGWFSFFDIGLGNGLRNKLTEALAQNDHELAKTYISTTYAILTFIIALVLILFSFISPLISWSKILNTCQNIILEKEINSLAIIIFIFFCLTFLLRLIGTILIADQRPSKAAEFDFYSNLISLLIIIIITNISNGSLLYIGTILSGTPVIVYFIGSLFYFKGKYKLYKPELRYIKLSKGKELFGLGISFFLIQLAGVLLFQTNNIIISRILSPTEVTPYNVAFKYFSILIMGFSILITPFWSAFTEAWIKTDFNWIKKTMNKLFISWILFFLVGCIMLFISPYVYRVWIGASIKIEINLSVFIFIWITLNIWNGIFSQFLNGLGKIKIQLYLAITTSLINLPLAVYLGIKLGLSGIILANILVVLIPVIIYPIQYFRIMNGTARGIWNQ